MPSRLDNQNRGVLEGRPNITFVEPKVMAVPPTPIAPETPHLNEVLDEFQQAKALANAVDVLATALQGRVNIKAKDMEIDLDPKVDAVVIQAMSRMYPDDDPTVITYSQYIQCKDRLLARGTELADQALQYNNPTVISEARKAAVGLAGVGETVGGLTTPIASPNPFYDDYEGTKKTAMYGTKKAKRGGLRPELDAGNMVIEAIDIEEFQDCMIKILVNYIWKNFIRPVVQIVIASLPIPGAALAARYVPKKICKCPPGFKVKEMVARGIPILGEKKPKKQKPPDQPDPNSIAGGK